MFSINSRVWTNSPRNQPTFRHNGRIQFIQRATFTSTGIPVYAPWQSYLYNPENISAWVIEVEERAYKKGFPFRPYGALPSTWRQWLQLLFRGHHDPRNSSCNHCRQVEGRVPYGLWAQNPSWTRPQPLRPKKRCWCRVLAGSETHGPILPEHFTCQDVAWFFFEKGCVYMSSGR